MSTTHVVNAAEIPIQSVTIYKSDKAHICRQFSLNITSGVNTVVVSNVSNAIDISSVRVAGLGGAARLADVVCIVPATPGLPEPSAALRALQQRKQALQDERLARSYAVSLLDNYAKSLSMQHVAPSEFATFMGAFHSEYLSAVAEVHKVDDQLRELEAEITSETETIGDGVARAKITMTLLSQNDCTVPLRLNYFVSNARWNAVYDLHASTTTIDHVSLHYRAEITQSTGEHWGNTKLTLSTQSMQVSEIPRLHTTRLVRIQPVGGSLFGGAPSQLAQDAPHSNFSGTPFTSNSGTGLFGSSTPASGGLFGARPSITQENPAPGGVFGSTSTGPFFGSSNTADRYAPNETSSTFGLVGEQQGSTHTASSAGGLFGSGPPPVLSTTSFFKSHDPPSAYPSTQQLPVSFGRSNQNSSFGTASSDSYLARENANAAGSQSSVQGPAPISEGSMTVTSSSLSASLIVQVTTTIPSDGSTHVVSVATFGCSSTISRICAPRLDNAVFLRCIVENGSRYRLLPGVMNVFLDEEYVSSSSIKDLGLRDSFEVALGVDPSCCVAYRRSQSHHTYLEHASVFGSGRKYVTKYEACTTIRNNGGAMIKNLVIMDSLPIPPLNDTTWDSIEVHFVKPSRLLETSTNQLVDARDHTASSVTDNSRLIGLQRKVRWSEDGGERKGKYEWVVDVLPGEELSLHAEWIIKAPSGSKWQQVIEDA
ncbi:hypothetical protein BXZ70DRAFT_947846 [Cristinia sonorae]|uniref:DUF4139 domain-containing protein n=1 Tax=Cristinia sonorae TaxID=1940300 RepID=A0A8K0XMT3_9AGAR|nr:hypothetical protein BXZ70DRAFT_947846 [Cristinia sonorae]